VPRRTIIFLAATPLAVVAILWILGRADYVGPFASERWTNVKTGIVADPRNYSTSEPFESDGGCASDTYDSSISWRRGWYLRAYTGPSDSMLGTYEVGVPLPPGAVFTGWQRGDRQLWVDPGDRGPDGTHRYLYFVRSGTPARAERWPQARFGCA
jgi:hypothetical protein